MIPSLDLGASAVNAVSDGVLFIDDDCVIVSANPAAARLLGTSGAMVGHSGSHHPAAQFRCVRR